jgi:hypothetical protein
MLRDSTRAPEWDTGALFGFFLGKRLIFAKVPGKTVQQRYPASYVARVDVRPTMPLNVL